MTTALPTDAIRSFFPSTFFSHKQLAQSNKAVRQLQALVDAFAEAQAQIVAMNAELIAMEASRADCRINGLELLEAKDARIAELEKQLNYEIMSGDNP